MQLYQDLNKDLQYRANKYLTQKLFIVNLILATKDSSECHLTKMYVCLRKHLHVETVAHLLSPLRQHEGQAPNWYSYTTWQIHQHSNFQRSCLKLSIEACFTPAPLPAFCSCRLIIAKMHLFFKKLIDIKIFKGKISYEILPIFFITHHFT